jgi:hypothetical protein
MTIASAYAGSHREVKIVRTLSNSILAAAGTAWELDVTYKEAEAERKKPVSVEQPIKFELPNSRRRRTLA